MTLKCFAERLPDGVWVRAVTYDPGAAVTWREWLSGEERAQVESFGAESRRREFLAGRAAARDLLGSRMNVAPEQVPLHRADDDAVDVRRTDWHVSIAHSNDRALAAASRRAVGTDLELIQPRDPAVARFLLREDERHLPDALPYAPDSSLVLLWALKEAVLKARRSGFRTTPKALRTAVRPEAKAATVTEDGGQQWWLTYAELDGFWATVAVPGD